jgi:hypothetical protein
MSYATQ